MKRAALVMLLAICTVALTNQSADAGTGKGLKAKIQVRNSNTASGRAITVFVVPDGTPAPTTKAQALALTHKNVGGAKTEVFRLKNGSYSVGAADTAAFNSLPSNANIPAGSFRIRTDVVLSNNTRTFTVNTPAGATSPFTPNLN